MKPYDLICFDVDGTLIEHPSGKVIWEVLNEKYVGNTLVTSIVVWLQQQLETDHVFADYLEVASAPGAYDEAIIVLGRAATLVDAKATPEEAAGYKRWLLRIAQTVAEAGKEDQGFLGRGGVKVNDQERSALGSIAATLGLEAAAR